MSAAHTAVADAVDGSIGGQVAGMLVLEEIKSDIAHPDLLYMRALVAWSQHGSEGLRAMLRATQKQLERGR